MIVDQEFVREYCERYGVKMTLGAGAPCLNGVPLVGEALRQLFTPVESESVFSYGLGRIKMSKAPKKKELPTRENVAISYNKVQNRHWAEEWNTFRMDKLVS